MKSTITKLRTFFQLMMEKKKKTTGILLQNKEIKI